MRRKTSVFFILTILIICTLTKVQAAYITNLGMEIQIPEGYINLIEVVNTNAEVLKEYNMDSDQIKEYYQKNGVVLDMIHQDRSKSFVIMKLANTTTKKIKNLNTLNETSLENFMAQYKEEKQKANQEVISQQKEIKNDTIYIHTQLKQMKSNQEQTNIDEYYTIANSIAIAISLNHLTGEIQQQELSHIIDSITFDKITVESEMASYLPILILIAVVVLLYGINLIKEKKSNIVIEEKEKSKLTKKAIEMHNMKDYTRFGGYLKFFFITLLLSILGMIIQIVSFVLEGIPKTENITWTLVHNFILSGQLLIEIGILIYFAIIVRRKEPSTIKKIKKWFVILGSIISVLTLIRICTTYMISLQDNQYYLGEIGALVRNLCYMIVWYWYYRSSMRVSIYYQEATIEESIEQPKNRIQKRKSSRLLSEAKIIDYFEEKGAISYGDAIAMSEIPNSYLRSSHFSELVNRKILKTKMGKVFLNQKNIEDPKFEKRRQTKTALWILLIYILATWIVTTI